MKKVLNIISTVIIVLLVVIVALLIVSRLFFGIEVNAVVTGSMEPDLPIGSLIIVKSASYEDINIGDDITFSREGSSVLVTHRVIQKSDETKEIITQGIVNNTADSPISYADIKGKVIFSISLIGYVVIFVNTLFGKVICITALVVIVLWSILSNRKKSGTEENTI